MRLLFYEKMCVVYRDFGVSKNDFSSMKITLMVFDFISISI